jgi:hypothetical protein|tara:strand:- start:788 stop:1051 length:264 start_codon:yes stop_codon:yes gene_type:complete
MPTYPVINKVTGEQKDVRISITEWDQWKIDNPDWDRDWSDPSTCPNSGEVGDWQSKMSRTHPGFYDIMKNKIAPKAPTNKSITEKYN